MPGILFVCTANVCRSPMAEALLADWLRRRNQSGVWWVSSAGIRAMDGTPASAYACDVMAERGLDLLKHRARRIHAGILAAHDAILCMTRSQREALQVQYPEHVRRIHLFSQVIGRTYDVPDPYGLEPEVYLSTANELADLVRRGGAKIVDLAQAPR